MALFPFVERWNNIMYTWLDDPYSVRPASIVDKFAPVKTHLKLKLLLKDIVADFLRLFKSEKNLKSKIWFLVLTQNNLDALLPVQEEVPGSIFTSFFRFRSTIKYPDTRYFLLKRRFFWNLLYPIYWLIYLTQNKTKALRYYELLLTVHGTYEECYRLLKKYRPKAIVFANDHLITARAVLLAANDLGIKTYYVQHATVGDYFPPLEFNYAFLDGEDSLNKYEKCGDVDSKVELFGMPKFDKYLNLVNKNDKVNVVGIAFNQIDSVEDVNKLLTVIEEKQPNLDIIVRPHPGDDRDLTMIFNNRKISDPKKEGAFDFLAKIDCLISGESSIHLEATLLNVFPLYYRFSPNGPYDIYGFLKNEFLKEYTQPQLLSKLDELKLSKPQVQEKAKYYNAAVGKDYFGRSAAKIAKRIIETSEE